MCATACGNDNSGTENKNTSSDTVEQIEHGAENNSGSNGQNGDNNGNSGNNGQPEGNGGNSGNNAQTGDNSGASNLQVKTQTLPSEQEIRNAIGGSYKVTVRSGGEDLVVASDGVYEYSSLFTYESIKVTIGEKKYPYTGIKNGKYRKIGTPVTGGDNLGYSSAGDLFLFAGETVSYHERSAVTFLGRNATKYTYSSGNANGYNVSYAEEIVIDDLTGACLKHEGHGVATDGFTGSSAKENFEIVEFLYGADNAAVQSFVDDLIAEKIDVYAWENTYFSELGLSSVDAPAGELYFSEWEYGTVRTDEEKIWNAQYRNYDTQENGIAAINALIQSFYNAGVTLGDETKAPLSAWNDPDGYGFDSENRESIRFYAAIGGNEEYIVTVSCDYITFSGAPYWRIDVEVGNYD
ncbi:MAG: hypothetical protein II896_04710 [Clostridia bacterium]|nr:hypothetical protein [Clostridia bacterium]